MKRKVDVTVTVQVEIDETKFTPEFMAEFRRDMYPFAGIESHLEHLAQMHARGLYDDTSFIEGYGWAKDMGIKFKVTDGETQLRELAKV